MFTRENYDEFIKTLKQLTFCTVDTVLKRRHDLLAFIDKNGRTVSCDCPTEFGSRWSEFTREEADAAPTEYRYFCGFADDVYFTKNSWDNKKRVCFMPAVFPDQKFGMPKVGDIIFGHVDEHDPNNRRFTWWNVVTKQDQRFAELVLGKIEFSRQKLEKKMTISRGDYSDRTLFLLVMAIRYQDVEFFAEMARNGETVGHKNMPVIDWLADQLSGIGPEFYNKVLERRKILDRKSF